MVAQNEELKTEVDRVTSALENATQLINENAARYADYGEQLTFAEKSIEALLTDNKELKNQMNLKENVLNENTQKVDHSSKAFYTVLSAKEMQIEQLKENVQKQEVNF